MASTALTTTSNKGRGIAKMDMSRFHPDKMKAAANAVAVSSGGSELGERGKFEGMTFPGDKLTFKKGEWSTGVKKTEKKRIDVKKDGEYVVIFPQMSVVWQKWVEKEVNDKENGGKKTVRVPEFKHLTPMVDGDKFPARDTLGDLDESDWEAGMNGRPQDPWKCLCIIPVRRVGDEEGKVHHIELSTVSGNKQAYYLFRDVGEELPFHADELPIVRLGAKNVDFNIPQSNSRGEPLIDKKTGKQKTAPVPVDLPTFEIIGWEAARDGDYADLDVGGGEATDDQGRVEMKARTESKSKPVADKAPAAKKAAPTAKPVPTAKKAAPAKGGKRKVTPVDDADRL